MLRCIVQASGDTIQKQTGQRPFGEDKFLIRIPVIPHSPYKPYVIFLHLCPEVRHRCCCLPRTASSTDNITAVRPPTVTAHRTVTAALIFTVSAECHSSYVATTHCRHYLTTHQNPYRRLSAESSEPCGLRCLNRSKPLRYRINPHLSKTIMPGTR